jgi:hypothetical protein
MAIPQKKIKNLGSPFYSLLTKAASNYRALLHKYIEVELKKTDNQMKSLKKEKHALLDKLVVLEGLVDPYSFKYPNLVNSVVFFVHISSCSICKLTVEHFHVNNLRMLYTQYFIKFAWKVIATLVGAS